MFIFFWAAGSTTGLSSLCPFCCFLKPTCGQLYQYWLLDPMYIHTWRDFPIPFKDIHFLDAYWNSNLVVFGNSDTPQVKTPRNMKTFNGIFLKGNFCHVRYSSSFTALFSASKSGAILRSIAALNRPGDFRCGEKSAPGNQPNAFDLWGNGTWAEQLRTEVTGLQPNSPYDLQVTFAISFGKMVLDLQASRKLTYNISYQNLLVS